MSTSSTQTYNASLAIANQILWPISMSFHPWISPLLFIHCWRFNHIGLFRKKGKPPACKRSLWKDHPPHPDTFCTWLVPQWLSFFRFIYHSNSRCFTTNRSLLPRCQRPVLARWRKITGTMGSRFDADLLGSHAVVSGTGCWCRIICKRH